MTTFIALKRVLAHFKPILAQRPLRIILQTLRVFIRVWKTGFGYRRRPPDAQAMRKPEDHSTLGRGSYSGIDVLASRIPRSLILFSRKRPREDNETELLPLPVVSNCPLSSPPGMIRSTSDSLGIVNYASHTSLGLTSTDCPYRQSSVGTRSRSTPNLARIARKSCARSEGDPVPDSHTLGMPPSPSYSRPQSCNSLADSVPAAAAFPQEVNLGDHAAPGITLHPNCETSQHNPGDNQDSGTRYDVPDADQAGPHLSQHGNSPTMASRILYSIVMG
jgi:hypothetical protein